MMTVIAPDKHICERLIQLRHRLLSSPQKMDEFERSPDLFLAELTELGETGSSVRRAVVESPRGVRFLTLDHCVSWLSTGKSESDPDAIPVLYVGVVLAAIYNVAVIGNVGVYHLAGANIGVGANAIALKNAKYTGAVDTPLPAATDKRLTPPPMHFSELYIAHSLHSHFVEQGVGESREKRLLRRALSKFDTDRENEITVSSTYRGTHFKVTASSDNSTQTIIINDGSVVV
ncbi:hypothetical protein [Actinomyces procaprae]|uniref:hypothetical protein n=1 Tax=Actinomyces procaprae TaxID=2560010 RepID=UPI00109DF829|nr:hypothetical protein [Actinomyces procaprae]